MQVNREDITKQLYRAYNARGIVSPSGAAGLSPTFVVGGGAHPSVATQQVGVMSSFVTGAAGVTGGVGLIVPRGAGAIAVVTDISIGPSTTAANYRFLIDGPAADVDYPPTQFPANLNTQNVSQETVPFFWGYVNAAATPALGNNAGVVVGSSGINAKFSEPPIVLAPGWGIVVACLSNALTYSVDIRFEAFELSPT